jgi:hypothetical protein
MICEYLNLAGLFSESIHFLRSLNTVYKKFEIENGYLEALEVTRQVANHVSSKKDFVRWFETTTVFNSMHPLFRKFYRLQALCIYKSMISNQRKKTRANLEIQKLINETGFYFFEKYPS